MKQCYLVYYKTYSRKFNEEQINIQLTYDLEKFARTHIIIEAYECIRTNKGSRTKEIGRRVI